MRKKILSCILMCLIIVSFSINVFSVDENQETNSTAENKTLEEQQKELNTKIDESNTKLEYVQGEMGETLKKVEELNDSITDYEAQYSDLENQITTLENQIKTNSAQIQEIQEEYDRKEKILKRRTVALYEAGETTYLDFLLTSKSIVEFLSNYYIISEIIEYDNNLLEELDYKKTKLEEAKQKQEEQEKELRVAKNKINSTNIL